MNESNQLVDFLFQIAIPLLTELTKCCTSKLLEVPVVVKAIEATGRLFPNIEGLEGTLKKWCESDDFIVLLKKLKNGERNITNDNVIASFLENSRFHMGDRTHETSKEILLIFFKKLEDEIMTTKDGLPFHSRREEVLHAEAKVLIQDVSKSMSNQLTEVRDAILKHIMVDDIEESPKIQEKIYHARIDEAKTLIQKGKARSAQEILQRLRKDLLGKSISGELEFRIATNLGACALESDNLTEAKTEFKRALSYKPNNEKALANAALADIMSGNTTTALDLSKKALDVDANYPHALSVFIQSLGYPTRKDEIDALLKEKPWISEDATCAFALGYIKLKANEYNEAEKYFRNCLKVSHQNPNVYELLAMAIFAPIQKLIKDGHTLPWRLPADLQTRIKQAKDLLGKAIDILKDYENRRHLHEALVNRAALCGILGDFDQALADCDKVLVEDNVNYTALQDKGITLLQLGKTSDAIETLKKIAHMKETPRARIILAQAYLSNEEYGEVLQILGEIWQPEIDDPEQIQIADLLLTAHSKLGNTSEIKEICQFLTKTWPSNPDALVVIANQRNREGKFEQAVELLNEALEYTQSNKTDLIVLNLADIYYSHFKFAEAAQMYERVVDKNNDNVILRRYLISLYNSRSYREALLISRDIRKNGPVIPVITEIETFILEFVGDLEKSKELLSQLTVVEPEKTRHRIRIGIIELRQNNKEKAREILSGISYEQVRNNSHELIQIANARLILGMSDVMLFAYRARRIDFNNPNVHLAYMWLFLNRGQPDQGLLTPKTVGIECVVQLKQNGEKKVFIITDEDADNRDNRELNSNDPLAKKLLGYKKNQTVSLKEGPYEELEYKIEDIQSKYVFAFQETINEFTTRFPDHPALQKVDIKNNDFSKVFLALDERSKLLANVLKFYKGNQLTLGAFAQLVGSNEIETWAGLIGQVDGRIIAHGNIKQELSILPQQTAIVVDITALLTIGYLDLWKNFATRFQQIIVPQSILDNIQACLVRNHVGIRPTMTLWKENNRYHRQEIPQAELDNGKRFLEKIIDFIKKKAAIVPESSLLEIDSDKFNELCKLIGRSAVCSILVAKHNNLPLYSDDRALRIIAEKEWQVAGIWIQSILADMRRTQIITEDEYHEAIEKLILANYFFVSVEAKDLVWILHRHNMIITPAVQRIFEVLYGPDCSEESAINVIADLIRMVWLEAPLFTQKLMILDLCLKTLITGRLNMRVLFKLKAALQIRFALLPLALQTIFQNIKIWEQTKLLKGGLII